ncbi:hypothetical protein HYALB_00009357 [Hymenoscyphus albidus]|uniref:Uncharacterized protein n=1 Tax=Hymenoscyphus albidus TaxID=595503 RepID=A0A9N9LQC0_9HELO|nr:hypothetical protein HYALB_00009357 [Hymenoscyphus albidus]
MPSLRSKKRKPKDPPTGEKPPKRRPKKTIKAAGALADTPPPKSPQKPKDKPKKSYRRSSDPSKCIPKAKEQTPINIPSSAASTPIPTRTKTIPPPTRFNPAEEDIFCAEQTTTQI